ncbi:hypothetical protein Tco_1032042 [Tanacetum coccineum]|uniref:Transposase (putative) gypsy type domain-containing protein n=1 Tax=Tanacetum coccineum TaxID=301880 RepID=A0ABQ5GB52_9ASTR
MILAELRSSRSLRPCASYTSRGAKMLLDLNPLSFQRSAASYAFLVRCLVGTRIIATVHLSLFPPFDERELDYHCSVFNISAELRPELADQNAIIKDSPEGKIGMYTHFIEFANYWVPLSKFLLCVLEYYQINLSQLSVIGAAKVSHFEIMCRAFGRIPTVGTFRRFYVNSISNGWLSFSKREGATDPCCYSNKFDSLKNWNNHFFWIDASVCPLSTSWFSGTSVVKDPLPVDEAVDLPCVELLNENRTLIRKYPETFLCFVGLSRSFTETDVRPTLLHDNDEGRCLVYIYVQGEGWERTLAENEVPLITETENRVISPSLQTISLVDHTIQDELNVNSGKRKKRVVFVSGSPPAKKARAEGIVISYSRPSTASKSPTAPRRLIRQGEQAAASSRTRPPSGRFVVLSSGSADTDIPATPQVVLLASSSQAGASVHVAESADDGRPLSAPELEIGTLSATPSQDNPVTCRNLLDHITPPGYWALLRNQHDVGFLDSFNINSAQHVCMVSELCLRYEHEIMTREKYEKRFTDSDAMVQQRDAKVVELKAKLEKSESEAAEVEELRKRVSDLEATVAMKVGEAASLTAQNAGLLEKVSALELERDGLKGQVLSESKMREEFVSHQDAVEQRFVERAAELDARIADVRRDMDNELYPHMLTAIAGRRWVVRHSFRLSVHKCARSFECRSTLEVEGKYVTAVSKFKGVYFPLLDELESLKDSPLALIMSGLTLKDDQGNTDTTPEFARFQPSLDQVVVPIYSESGSVDREMLLFDAIPAIRQSAKRRGLCPPSGSAPGGTSSFVPPYDSSIGVADYQVSTLVLPGDGGPTNPSPVVQPHDDLFDTSVLDKSGDV